MIVFSLGVITALKTTLGHEATELSAEKGIGETFNLQEGNEQGKPAVDEAREWGESNAYI